MQRFILISNFSGIASLAKIVTLKLYNLVHPTFLCPTQAFPGVWEIPVNLHYVEGLASGQCSYLDQCVFALLGSEDVFEWLQEDFRRHYDVSCQEIHLVHIIFHPPKSSKKISLKKNRPKFFQKSFKNLFGGFKKTSGDIMMLKLPR